MIYPYPESSAFLQAWGQKNGVARSFGGPGIKTSSSSIATPQNPTTQAPALWLEYGAFCADRAKFENAKSVYARAVTTLDAAGVDAAAVWDAYVALVRRLGDANATKDSLARPLGLLRDGPIASSSSYADDDDVEKAAQTTEDGSPPGDGGNKTSSVRSPPDAPVSARGPGGDAAAPVSSSASAASSASSSSKRRADADDSEAASSALRDERRVDKDSVANDDEKHRATSRDDDDDAGRTRDAKRAKTADDTGSTSSSSHAQGLQNVAPPLRMVFGRAPVTAEEVDSADVGLEPEQTQAFVAFAREPTAVEIVEALRLTDLLATAEIEETWAAVRAHQAQRLRAAVHDAELTERVVAAIRRENAHLLKRTNTELTRLNADIQAALDRAGLPLAEVTSDPDKIATQRRVVRAVLAANLRAHARRRAAATRRL